MYSNVLGIDDEQLPKGSGTKMAKASVDFESGIYTETGRTFDFAIEGDGFFNVEFTNKAGETSTMYTRAGQFTLTREGYLVTNEGDYLLDTQNRRIRLNTLLDSRIEGDGTIYQNGTAVARIQVTDFEDYNYLEKYGENYYRPVEGARTRTADVNIRSGYLEMSNVNTVTEMVDMISVTRAYESNQKIIQTYDSSLEIAVNQLGKL